LRCGSHKLPIMRIVLLPSAYAPAVGGVEELTKRLAHHLIALGNEVEIWVHRHPASLPTVEVIEGVTVRRFAMSLPAASVDAVWRFGPEAWLSLREMRRATRAFKPDLFHVQCFSVNGVYASALSLLFGVPLVVTLQGETVMDDNDIYTHSTSLRLGLRLGLRVAGAVTGCSQFTLTDAVARFGLPADAGMVIPNGVDLGDPEKPVPLDLPFAEFVLGLGRVVKNKGFDLLIDAFHQLGQDRPDIGLVIGGDGAARFELLAKVQAMGLGDRVVLPGKLSRGQVTWAMGHARTFVLPSRVEPFGIVVLEAMSAGLPVVVSIHGGATEIVRDGVDGLVVDPFDPQAIGAALGRVLDDTPERRRLTESGHARVEDYGWGDITERYVTLYRTAISTGRKPWKRTA
jgi:glycogen synthase